MAHASPTTQHDLNAEDFGESIDDSGVVAVSPAPLPIYSQPVFSDPPLSYAPINQSKPEVNLFDDGQITVCPGSDLESANRIGSKKKRATENEGTPLKKKKRKSLSQQHRCDIDDIFKGI